MTINEIKDLVDNWKSLDDCCHEPDKYISARDVYRLVYKLVCVAESARNPDLAPQDNPSEIQHDAYENLVECMNDLLLFKWK